jgi:hypothetical protein
LPEANFGDRYAHSLRDQEGGDKKFAAEHPIVDTGAKLAGGVASMVPVMAAAPAAFGLTGPMSTMIRNGAASGAALSAADAAVRGEDIGTAAGIGGVIGAAGGPVGRASARWCRRWPIGCGRWRRFPRTSPRSATSKFRCRARKRRKTRLVGRTADCRARRPRRSGARERARLQGFAGARVNQARDEFSAGLDPTGANASTAPQDAAEKIASELIAQEQARQAAQAANVAQVGQEGGALARGLDPGGQVRAPSAGDAAETSPNGLRRRGMRRKPTTGPSMTPPRKRLASSRRALRPVSAAMSKTGCARRIIRCRSMRPTRRRRSTRSTLSTSI